jgi:aspartate/methionine/tyrosine aminotransferase
MTATLPCSIYALSFITLWEHDLSKERQTQLINWAKANHAELLADEIFHDPRFEGPLRKSILAEAGNKKLFCYGSLSKSFMVGLRSGWLLGDEERLIVYAP